MAGGTVGIFAKKSGPPPSPQQYLRLPNHVADLDQEGRFSIKIPVGEFYIGAMLSHPDKFVDGPPQEGDFILTIKDKDNNPKLFSVQENSYIDLGSIKGGISFLPEEGQMIHTAIRGTIFNESGDWAKGIRLVARKESSGQETPASFVSQPSAKDGFFFLRLPGGGTYKLSIYGHKYSEGRLVMNNQKISDNNGQNYILILTIEEGEVVNEFDLKIIQ